MTFPKIQKYLADHGIASRREIERWIEVQALYIDNRLVQLGMRVPEYLPHLVQYKEKIWKIDPPVPTFHSPYTLPEVLVYNKPEGLISARVDDRGRPTVFEQLPPPAQGRWIGIGRLDCNTRGLLLFTTNGELAYRLMHPRYQLERIYKARVRGRVTSEKLLQVKNGMWIEAGSQKYWARFAKVIDLKVDQNSNHWFQVSLFEGRYREVRALWSAVGLQVTRLLRIQYGPIQLPPTLRAGSSIRLTEEWVRKLCRAVHLKIN